MKIIFRHDDVLDISHPDPFPYFERVHEIFKKHNRSEFVHTPTIVVEDIQTWPYAVDYIREEVAKGRLHPQLHGFQHIHYDQLTRDEMGEHLIKSMLWMEKELGVAPTKWYTPWGAEDDSLRAVAWGVKLKLVGTKGVLKTRDALARLRKPQHYPIESWDNQTVMFHWWDYDIVNRIEQILSGLGSLLDERVLS